MIGRVSWDEQVKLLNARYTVGQHFLQRLMCVKCGRIYCYDSRGGYKRENCRCGGKLIKVWIKKGGWIHLHGIVCAKKTENGGKKKSKV